MVLPLGSATAILVAAFLMDVDRDGSRPIVPEVVDQAGPLRWTRVESDAVIDPRALKAVGLGLSRTDFVDPLRELATAAGQSWESESVAPGDGAPRMIAESQTLILTLTGPADNLEEAALILFANPNDQANMGMLIGSARVFLQVAFPDWKYTALADWVTQGIDDGVAAHTSGRRRVTLQRHVVGVNTVFMLVVQPSEALSA